VYTTEVEADQVRAEFEILSKASDVTWLKQQLAKASVSTNPVSSTSSAASPAPKKSSAGRPRKKPKQVVAEAKEVLDDTDGGGPRPTRERKAPSKWADDPLAHANLGGQQAKFDALQALQQQKQLKAPSASSSSSSSSSSAAQDKQIAVLKQQYKDLTGAAPRGRNCNDVGWLKQQLTREHDVGRKAPTRAVYTTEVEADQVRAEFEILPKRRNSAGSSCSAGSNAGSACSAA